MMINAYDTRSAEHRKQLADKFSKDIEADPQRMNVPWPLPNMKEITEHEFWHYFMTYSPLADAYLGQYKMGDKLWGTARAYYFDCNQYISGGFAVMHFYWEKKTRYFTWKACDHDFHSTKLGNCWYKYTCSKCTRSYEVDSSD